MSDSYSHIAGMIDHALLTPASTVDELEAGCRMARAYGAASVCILPYAVRMCAEILRGSDVQPSTVIGFPHGAHKTAVKQSEAEQAVADGCVELDMVVNISQVVSGRWEYVRSDIQAVIDVAHHADRKVKVIFENCWLNDEQKIRLCEICSELNADWVKTSTGFGSGGATIDDVQLMRRHSASHVQVKAAGGIRDYETLLAMRELGVTRCGTSRTKEILDQCRERLGLEPLDIRDAGGRAGY